MSKANLIFPHQLFEKSELLSSGNPCYLIEEYLFFKHYPFHKQKIAFHRASMQFYKSYLSEKKVDVTYIEAVDELSDIRKLIPHLAKKGIERITLIDPTDDWLQKRINRVAKENKVEVEYLPSPLFLNSKEELGAFFKEGRKRYFHHSFYVEQRKRHQIMVDDQNEPEGGRWSFDDENRKKYPRKKTPPEVKPPVSDEYYEEAVQYVKKHFANHYGEVADTPMYPHTFVGVKDWLDDFLQYRFVEFGPYEDAIVNEAHFLHHSVLTPMLNTGLLTPREVIDRLLTYGRENDIPINSLEGIIRQIIGWREFIRGMYQFHGVEERTRNYWNFNRKIPISFYNGTTGIDPIDDTIKKLLKTGYSHHIERLMVFSNFMLLCEFDPDEVYQWFMEMYIDAYDWVMVPNVYGMGQFADGGLMATKPYISSSNYLRKMSDYKKGDWQEIWDALFWRFMNVHRSFFEKNPRIGMLVRSFDKFDEEKQERLMNTANDFLEQLDKGEQFFSNGA